MEEKVFFNQGGVSVSNARFIVNGQTYAMNAVTSVKQAADEPARGGPIIIGLLGLLLCLPGTKEMIAMGAIMLITAVVWGLNQKAEYMVVLHTSAGESQALKSNDKAHVEAVVAALNQSIVHRG